MNEIQGYYESPAFTGEGAALPAGAYVCVIKRAVDEHPPGGKRRLALFLDIAEGEYKGYYQRRYQADMERDGTNAKWKGVFRQGYEGEKPLGYFRGMMTSIEKSNPGYKWDWNERGLKGKRVGVIFGREQFRGTDGELHWSTKPLFIRSVDALKNARIPEDKYADDAPKWGAPTGTASGQNSYQTDFYDIDDSEDDLPF